MGPNSFRLLEELLEKKKEKRLIIRLFCNLRKCVVYA